MKKTHLDHPLKRHFPPTGKPILDALLNASESLTIDRALADTEESESAMFTPAQAQHSPLPLAFQYTNLQFNDLPRWARDTILALEAKANNAQSQIRRGERLAEALAEIAEDCEDVRSWQPIAKRIRKALADWNATESPADADALEALDQLEQAQ